MIKPDRMIYLVLCRYRDGLAWAERPLDRTHRKDTLEDIMSGELPNVVQVIELNFVENTSRDVTGDFVVEARRDEIRSKLFAQLAQQDHDRALRKENA